MLSRVPFLLLTSAAAVGCISGAGDRLAMAAPRELGEEFRNNKEESVERAPSAFRPGQGPFSPGDSAPSAHAQFAEKVRELAKPSCGACHRSSLPTAKPNAVAVFDLDRSEWYATMSDHQLDAFRQRGAKIDRDAVRALLDEEAARRRASRSEVNP
jgi:hypothetical protein